MENIHSAENAHKLSESFYPEKEDKQQLDFILEGIKEAAAEGKFAYIYAGSIIEVVYDSLIEFGYKIEGNTVRW